MTVETSLDAYAGFGTTPETALRDETIAYWEAFRREHAIRNCMADAGFEYAPAIALPTGDMLEIADALGVDAAPGTAADQTDVASPVSWNRAYVHGLSAPERERYRQTLLEKSAADMAEADRTGVVPHGRAQDFATGVASARPVPLSRACGLPDTSSQPSSMRYAARSPNRHSCERRGAPTAIVSRRRQAWLRPTPVASRPPGQAWGKQPIAPTSSADRYGPPATSVRRRPPRADSSTVERPCSEPSRNDMTVP